MPGSNVDIEYSHDAWQPLTSLIQGAYRDDNGKPVVLNVVRQAEDIIAGENFMECVFTCLLLSTHTLGIMCTAIIDCMHSSVHVLPFKLFMSHNSLQIEF